MYYYSQAINTGISICFFFCVQYEASVEENTENVEVMRFKASDMDMQNTDNWQAEYNIVSGNGGGHFKIETDPKTNEGVLMLVKVFKVFFPPNIHVFLTGLILI